MVVAEAVEAGWGVFQYAVSGGVTGDGGDGGDRLVPHLRVRAVELGDRPVAAADEAVGAEALVGDLDRPTQVGVRSSPATPASC